MLIKLDRSFFMYLTLMLSISFNVFAKDEDSSEIEEADECVPCERLNLIDAILGIDSLEKVVTNPNYPYKHSDFYKEVVLLSDEEEDEDYAPDPEAVKKWKNL